MIAYRTQLTEGDSESIGKLLESTGFFHLYEIDVAKELSAINLLKGDEASGYQFIVAEELEKMLGYCCFGPNPCTESSYDLYWIAVHKDQMKRGIGRKLMELAETSIARMGGSIVWVETSGRAIYESTRAFYLAIGYEKVAVMPDFYAPGDDKVVFRKRVVSKE
jgi:ribosomal protein S18 acetylase RimI-like enzyme